MKNTGAFICLPPMTHHFSTVQSSFFRSSRPCVFYPTMKLTAAAILSLAGLASAETYFKEQFDDVSSPVPVQFF